MKRLFTLTLFLIISLSLQAQKPPIYSTKAGAIKGYDPVAYFKERKAVKGLDGYSYEWKGATWYFSSEGNVAAFIDSPHLYAPQFGGYCAYAVSQNYTYRVDPEAWKIVDGKLYLNYSLKIQEKWEANQAQFIEDAEKNWPGVLK